MGLPLKGVEGVGLVLYLYLLEQEFGKFSNIDQIRRNSPQYYGTI
jgi:hypothetical protein